MMFLFPIMYIIIPEALLDVNGRPKDPCFYTGSVAYYNLLFQVYELWNTVLMDESNHIGNQDDIHDSNKIESADTQVPAIKWLSKVKVESILKETITNKQVSLTVIHVIFSCNFHTFMEIFTISVE